MNDSIRYFLPRLKGRYDDTAYSVKRWWQRLVRGYSDADIWNMSDYLSEHLYKMMDRFIKSKRIGYPAEFGADFKEQTTIQLATIHPLRNRELSEERAIQEWENILVKIRDGFKAADDILNDNCPAKYPYMGVDYILNPELETDEHKQQVKDWLDKYLVWESERKQKFEEGMDLFKKYFFALWD